MEKNSESVTYELNTSVEPEVFGKSYWFAFHDLASRVPCIHCRKEAESFMKFFHDLKNYELGKKIMYKENFLYWMKRISSLKRKRIILK